MFSRTISKDLSARGYNKSLHNSARNSVHLYTDGHCLGRHMEWMKENHLLLCLISLSAIVSPILDFL